MRELAWQTSICFFAGMSFGWLVFADHGAIIGRATSAIIDDRYVEAIPNPADNIIDPPVRGSMQVAMP